MSAGAKTAAPPVVAPARRPAVAHPRHGSERQARAAAHAALSGGVGLAAGLTPSPAATAPRLGDAALPLPWAVRLHAERRLGADLSAVRLHIGPEAAAWAADQAAVAVTAGRDIYFARGAFDPGAVEGRELLLHELAHTLQQTGRRTADGRLAATPAQGDGALQRQENDAPYQAPNTVIDAESDYKLELERIPIRKDLKDSHTALAATSKEVGASRWKRMTYRDLVDGHRPGLMPDTFDILVKEMALLLGLSTDSEDETAWDSDVWPKIANVIAFDEAVQALRTRSDLLTVFGRSGAGYGFVYDCFKKLELFTGAMTLLQAAPRLRTLAWHGKMQILLDSSDGLDAARQAMNHSGPKALLAAMEARVNELVFVPNASGKPLMMEDGVTLREWVKDVQARAGQSQLVAVPNELHFGLHSSISAFASAIEGAVANALTAPGAPVPGRVGSIGRYNLSRLFLVIGDVYAKLSVEDHGGMALEGQKPFGEALSKAGSRGMAFWRAVTGPDQPKFQDDPRVRDDPAGKTALKSLSDQAEAFFKLEAGEAEIPMPGPYAQRIEAWKRSLPGLVALVDEALGTARAKRDQKGVDAQIASDNLTRFHAALIDGLTRTLPGGLARYSFSEDLRATEDLKIEDVRGAHRIGMAAALMEVSRVLGWKALHDRADRWFMSRDRSESHVYLLSDWELSSGEVADFNNMSREIGGRIANWPVTGAALATIFIFLETMERSGALDQILREGPPAGSGDTPTHRLVDRAVAGLPMPKRWEVKSYVFAMNEAANARARAAAEKAMAEAAAAATATAQGETPAEPADGAVAPASPTTGGAAPAAATAPVQAATPAGLQIGELIVNHPKTRAMAAALGIGSSDFSLAFPAYDQITAEVKPYAMDGALRVFAWQVPSSETVVKVARFSPSLNQQVLNQWSLDTGQTPPLAVDSDAGVMLLDSLDGPQWLEYLMAGAADGRLSAATSLAAAADLDSVLTGTRAGYREDLRKASILDRRQLVKQHETALADPKLEVRVLAPVAALNALRELPKVIFPTAQLALDTKPGLTPLQPLAAMQQAIAALQLVDDLETPVSRAYDNHQTLLIAGLLSVFSTVKLTYDAAIATPAGMALLRSALAVDETPEQLTAPRKKLGDLLAVLETSRIQHQVDMGFRGEVAQDKSDYQSFKEKHPELWALAEKSAGAKTVVRLFGIDKENPGFVNGIQHATPLAEGEAQFGDWHLTEVRNAFTYIPSFYADKGKNTKDPGFRPGMAVKGYLSESQMRDFATRAHADPDSVKDRIFAPDAVLLLLQTPDQTDSTPVKAGDFGTLDGLAHMANIGSIISALEGTAEAVKFVMEIVMDVVTLLFGGVGQAAKTSAEVLLITQSDEFQTLVDAFQQDPGRLVTELFDTLKGKVLEPSFLMRYLLFPKGGPLEVLTSLARGNGAARAPKAGASKRKSLFSKTLGALLDLGRHIGGAFSRLQERFQGPMGGLRGTVVSRPKIRWTVDLVAKHGPTIITLIETLRNNPAIKAQVLGLIAGEGSKTLDPELLNNKELTLEERASVGPQNAEGPDKSQGLMQTVLDALNGKANEEKDAFDKEIERVMGTLSQLELPKVIVPLEMLIGSAVELIFTLAKRSGAKGKIADIARRVGQPVIDTYVEEVAKQIRNDGADPNLLWENKVLPMVNEHFIVARDETVAGLYGVIDKTIGPFREGLATIGGKPVEAGAFKYGGKPADVTVTPVEGDYGAPLRDPEAMPPKLAGCVKLPSGAGAPLDAGVRASAEERFGHDFKHVRVHESGEGEDATAPVQALALTSGSHIFVNPKISVTSDHGREVLDHELTHVLQQTGRRPIGEPHDPRPRRGAGRKGLTVDRHDEGEAVRTARKVRNRKSDAPVHVSSQPEEEGVAPAFDPAVAFDVLGLIASYKDVADFAKKMDAHKAGKGKGEDIKTMAVGLWSTILTEKVIGQGGVTPTFDTRQKELQTFLSGHSDAIKKVIPALVEKSWLTIEPPKSSKDKKGKAAEPTYEFRPGAFAGALSAYVFVKTGVAIAIDLDADPTDKKKFKVDKARIHYLNLGKVPFDSPLWKGLDFKNDALKHETATRMAVLDPAPGVWNPARYEIDSAFVTDLSDRSLKRPKAKLPTKKDYLKLEGPGLEGLRLGKHKNFTNLDSGAVQKEEFGKNRESHHTTQFLLAQYFHNKREAQKPFASGVRYPGVNRVGGGDTGLVSSIGNIDIMGTYGGDSGRGDPMPALLIAAETHRQGRLHVSREGKWLGAEEQAGSLTQGFAIDNKFRSELPDWLNRLHAKSNADFQKQVAGHSDDAVKAGIVEATNRTYRWMYQSIMRPALAEALPKNELAYYRGLAARDDKLVENKATGKLKAEYDMTPADLDQVASKADSHNRAVMGDTLKWVL